MSSEQQQYRDLYDKYITEPLNLELEIEEIARDAARQMTYKDKAEFNFLEEDYTARGLIRGRKIFLAISNETHREKAMGDYVPYTVDCDIDNNFTMVENYRAIFAGFLKHVAGIVEPEVVE